MTLVCTRFSTEQNIVLKAKAVNPASVVVELFPTFRPPCLFYFSWSVEVHDISPQPLDLFTLIEFPCVIIDGVAP